MDNSIDKQRNRKVPEFDKDILDLLLCEHAYDLDTKECNKPHHIYWATDNYENNGVGFSFFDEIKTNTISGRNGDLIRPRAAKTTKEREKRTRDKAEVFTPLWICNAQNNLVDNEWFGYKDVFNKEISNGNKHDWIPTESKIVFPNGKTWQEYVCDTRLEIACGEAPYLISRHDTTTGEPIVNLQKRIGLLDRKLRVVSENVSSVANWYKWALIALKSTYGFEWQGDNLLLARKALLLTFIDYYKDFANRHEISDTEPQTAYLKHAAYIISWNVFQMDGIKMVLPMTCHNENKADKCVGCKKHDVHQHNGIRQLIANWDRTDSILTEHPISIIEFQKLLNTCQNEPTNHKSRNSLKFDAVVGNPPYQSMDGGAGASAANIFQTFVENAIDLDSQYVTIITPSRWFCGGKNLASFRKRMLKSTSMKIMCDFIDSHNVFPDLGRSAIKGGVNYFLYETGYNGKCNINTLINNKIASSEDRYLNQLDLDIFVRYNGEAQTILDKILPKAMAGKPRYKLLKANSMATIVSSRKPFGLPTDFNDFTDNTNGTVQIYAHNLQSFIERDKIETNHKWIDKWKVLIPEAIGVGDPAKDWLKPIIAGHNTCCTETYLLIGPFDSKEEAECVYSYMQTKFFHFLLSLRKISQHTTQDVYSFIPLQDFNQKWTDEKLFDKYHLTKAERLYINKTIYPKKD